MERRWLDWEEIRNIVVTGMLIIGVVGTFVHVGSCINKESADGTKRLEMQEETRRQKIVEGLKRGCSVVHEEVICPIGQ